MDEQLITLAETEHGLVIALTGAGFGFLDQHHDGHTPAGGYDWDVGTDSLLRRLLDSFVEHSQRPKQWLWPNKNDYGDQGWMTNAPIWVTEPEISDDDTLVNFENAYWLHNYAIRDELGEMLQNGYVIFEACPFSAMEPEEDEDA